MPFLKNQSGGLFGRTIQKRIVFRKKASIMEVYSVMSNISMSFEIAQGQLSKNALKILEILRGFKEKTSRGVFPSAMTLADLAGFCRTYVFKALKELEVKGFIQRKPRKAVINGQRVQLSNEYILLDPQPEPAPTPDFVHDNMEGVHEKESTLKAPKASNKTNVEDYKAYITASQRMISASDTLADKSPIRKVAHYLLRDVNLYTTSLDLKIFRYTWQKVMQVFEKSAGKIVHLRAYFWAAYEQHVVQVALHEALKELKPNGRQ